MEAFTEVNEIIKLMPEELVNKIPSKFREMIQEERDRNYVPDIKEPLENCKLKEETIIILGLMYRDFLCSPEEKSMTIVQEEKWYQKIFNIIKNIFKRN